MRRTGFSVGLGILISAIVWASPARSATLEPIGSATYSSPTYVTSDPRDPDRLFVTEQPGTIRVTTPAGTSRSCLNLTDLVLDGDERGLWSMAFAPDFAQSGLFYVAYSADLPGTDSGTIRLDEFREQGTPAATKATQREVLSISNNTATFSHNGGQLQFGPDGYLYWSVGDDENGTNSQDAANLLGKILRIDPRGSSPGQYTVPADNPFVRDRPALSRRSGRSASATRGASRSTAPPARCTSATWATAWSRRSTAGSAAPTTAGRPARACALPSSLS